MDRVFFEDMIVLVYFYFFFLSVFFWLFVWFWARADWIWKSTGLPYTITMYAIAVPQSMAMDSN